MSASHRLSLRLPAVLMCMLSTQLYGFDGQPAVAPTASSQSAALDGEWLCSEYQHNTASFTQPAAQVHYISIAQGLLQTDTIDADMQLQPQFAADNNRFIGNWLAHTAGQPSTQRKLQWSPASGQLNYTDYDPPTGNKQKIGTCRRFITPTDSATVTSQTTTVQAAPAWQWIKLADAHPTQPAVGYDQIYARQAQYRDKTPGNLGWKRAFDDWCKTSGLQGVQKKTVTPQSSLLDPQSFSCKKQASQRNIQALKTAVLGPGNVVYLTDGHHSVSSLWNAPVRNGDEDNGTAGGALTLPVRIQADYRHLNNASFWRTMRQQGYTRLTLPDGATISPAQLPTQLGLSNGLQDDPYRSLLYFTRKVGYQAPDEAPEFLEFYWSDWLRAAPRNFHLSDYDLTTLGRGDGSDRGYLQAVHDAARLITQAAPTERIAASGQTAAAMGQLKAVNNTALQQLGAQTTSQGKLAAALAYRQRAASTRR